MADAISSQSIQNLDATASPYLVQANTTGVGAPGSLKESSDFVTPTALGLQATASKYKMVRLPMYAKVKDLTLTADAALDSSTGLALDVGAYYSDSAFDGTPVALQGTAISVNCFAAAIAFQASFNNVRADSAWSVENRNLPLWVALGLSANTVTGAPPAGFIDVVVAVHTAATTGVSHALGISVKHVA